MTDEKKIRERLKNRTSGALSAPSSGSLLDGQIEPEIKSGFGDNRAGSLLDDQVDEVKTNNPSLGEQGGAALRHGVPSVVRGAGVLASAAVTAKAFGAAGLLGGPHIATAAAVVGGIAGLAGADKYLPELAPPVEDEPPELQGIATGARIFGEAVGGGAVPISLGIAGAKTGLVGVDRILHYARQAPGKAFLAEVSSGFSAGTFGGATKNAGGTDAQVAGASLVGGVLNPAHWANVALKSAGHGISRLTATLPFIGRDGPQLNKAAQLFQQIVTESGDDPAQIAALLRQKGLVNSNATSAQATGNEGLAALEGELVKLSAKFGTDSQKAAKQSLDDARTILAAMRSTKDPRLLKIAAETQEQYIQSLIRGKLAAAEDAAVETARKIDTQTPIGREQVGIQAKRIVKESLQTLRATEEGLYNVVPRKTVASTNNVADAYREARGYLNEGESLGAQVDEFFKNIIGNKRGPISVGPDGKPIITTLKGAPSKPVTTGELLRQRSILLTKARDAVAANRPDLARIYGDLGDAVLKDLDGSLAGDATYDTARAFSKQLHDSFTRTFAGDVLAKNPKGAPKIYPELVLEQAFGQGEIAGKVRFQQLRDAVELLPREGIGGAQAVANSAKFTKLQDEFLRTTASELVDLSTGKIRPEQARKFLKSERETLDVFPEIRNVIEDSISTADRAGSLAKLAGGAKVAAQTKTAFGKLAGYSDPADAVQAALKGKDPVSEFGRLVKFAKSKNHAETLLNSVLDNAYRNAGVPGGVKGETAALVDFGKLKAQLFDPITPNSPSVLATLQREGVVSKAQIDTFKQVFDEAAKIQKALTGTASQVVRDQVKKATLLESFVARFAGARFAASVAKAVPGGGGGDSIQIAAAGASLFKGAFEKLGDKSMIPLLQRGALDKEFAAMLLTRPVDAAHAAVIARRAHAYALVTWPDLFKDERAGAQDDNEKLRESLQQQNRRQSEHGR